MAKWSVVTSALPGPYEIIITWPATDPLAPPLTASMRFMDSGQANFVATAIGNELLRRLGPA